MGCVGRVALAGSGSFSALIDESIAKEYLPILIRQPISCILSSSFAMDGLHTAGIDMMPAVLAQIRQTTTIPRPDAMSEILCLSLHI